MIASRMKPALTGLLLGICALPVAARPARSGSRILLERPGEREFVRDLAGMVTPEDATRIRSICDKLLTEKATPIIVVTIESMARYGRGRMRIESFAMRLFNQWGIGHARINDQTWNTGILLLVSKLDRKARIELGAGWGREQDGLCRQIMDNLIIPDFKNGDFSAGIVLGVEALDKMARGKELPCRPRPTWHHVVIAIAVAMAIFTVVSLIRRGAGGWAWLFWAALFGGMGLLLHAVLTRGSSGGGGFSGGSFGGGFSGGGGATGSW